MLLPFSLLTSVYRCLSIFLHCLLTHLHFILYVLIIFSSFTWEWKKPVIFLFHTLADSLPGPKAFIFDKNFTSILEDFKHLVFILLWDTLDPHEAVSHEVSEQISYLWALFVCIIVGSRLLIRQGCTKCMGQVTKIIPLLDDMSPSFSIEIFCFTIRSSMIFSRLSTLFDPHTQLLSIN